MAKTQNEIAIKALSSGKGTTAKQLAAKGIANPRAVISNLRKAGVSVQTVVTETRSGRTTRYVVTK